MLRLSIIYLMNFAWEGYCVLNNFDAYEVGPFNIENDDFAIEYYGYILKGGKFNHKFNEFNIAVPKLNEMEKRNVLSN